MGDQRRQLPLALLPACGIYGFYVPRAVRQARGVFALVAVFGHPRNTPRPRSAAEALVGAEGLGGLFRLRGGRGGGATGDGAVDGRGGLGAHGVGDVGIDVQRRGDAVVADDGGEGLHVHAGLQRQRGEGVAEVVEAELSAPGVVQDRLYPLAHRGRVQGRVGLHRGRENPLRRGAASHFDEDVEQGLGDQQAPRRRFCLWRGDGELAARSVDLPLHSQLSRFGIQV